MAATTRRTTMNMARGCLPVRLSKHCAPQVQRSPPDSENTLPATPACSIPRSPLFPDEATMTIRKTLSACLASYLLSAGVMAAEPVSITVRADRPGATIDPAIYGQFAEHLGRLIYE